jgi:capsular exopolysaccharide synthesis family protein
MTGSGLQRLPCVVSGVSLTGEHAGSAWEGEEDSTEGFSIQDAWAIIQMQRWVIVACVLIGLGLACTYAVTATRYYDSRAVVHISTIANQEMEMGESVENVNLVWNRDLYLRTQIALVKSRSFRNRVLEKYENLGLDDGVGVNARGMSLLASVEITPRKGTELVDIRASTPDPALSARLANLTAEALEADSLERFTQAAVGAQRWLRSQKEEYEQRIETASRELREYQRQHDMADVEEQTTLGARLESLKAAYGEANSERVQHETMVRTHEALLKRGQYADLAKSMDSPLVELMNQQYTEARQRVAELSAVYGEKFQARQLAEKEAERREQDLRAEIERTLSAEKAMLGLLMSKETDLKKAIGGGKNELLDFQSHYQDYERKRLALENAKEFYRQMNTRLAELDLQSKTQLNNVRIVETAQEASSPSSPDVLIALAGGVTGGLVLGLAAAGAREWLDDTISSPLDVSTYLRVPLLGMIPQIEADVDEHERTLYTHYHPKSGVAEAMRGLRTLIHLNPSGRTPRRLLVTSALASEGKTSTATRLAVAFANIDRRVVMVDCDLRRPRLHKVFGNERDSGVSDVIRDTSSLQSVVRPTVVPNLFYVSAGAAIDRPNEALASPRMETILDGLEERFDLVIVDTPPSVLLSDSRILSRLVDHVIVMVKEKSTSRALIREAIRSIQRVGGDVLGVVVNEIDWKRQKSNYYYGYGYRYDRYYSDDDESAAAK